MDAIDVIAYGIIINNIVDRRGDEYACPVVVSDVACNCIVIGKARVDTSLIAIKTVICDRAQTGIP
ncbi:Uncharacterised protein [uncultured archaeon]|nr:Uncharacterised protein [uncultured archaeon]